MDAAATGENALCEKFSTDGLNDQWMSPTFCNPPFKRFGDWVEKAHSELVDNGVASCIIGPSACSQSWFHRYLPDGIVLAPTKRICFLLPDGTYPRDKKTGKPSGANGDTMIYLFGYGAPARNCGFLVRPLVLSQTNKPGELK